MTDEHDVIQRLRKLTQAKEDGGKAWRQAIVEVMSKPPSQRGVNTYALAAAAGLSRQQLHQIYRDETGKNAEPDNPVGE